MDGLQVAQRAASKLRHWVPDNFVSRNTLIAVLVIAELNLSVGSGTIKRCLMS